MRNNLVAFLYVPRAAPVSLDVDLLAWLAPQVHDYLAPKKAIVLQDPIRRLPDGSVDLSALPKQAFGVGGTMSPLEKVVHDAFQEVLGVKQPIGLRDDFFSRDL